jgi:glycosyltransferase involved in cell wall biosynthesis
MRAYLRRAHAVVALTPESAKAIESSYGVPGERIEVIPIGVSPAQHQVAGLAARRAARDDLGIPEGADVGAVVGALSREKDVARAVDAAGALSGFHLVVAGDGPERQALEARAARAAPGRVHFTGSVRDPGVVYDAADLMVLTSRTEGLPGVLIEAGLRELPAVATDVGYVRAIVVDGKTGILVADGSRSELESAITRVLREPTQLGKAARRHCLAHFDLAHVTERWESLLEGCTGSTIAPPTGLVDR